MCVFVELRAFKWDRAANLRGRILNFAMRGA